MPTFRIEIAGTRGDEPCDSAREDNVAVSGCKQPSCVQCAAVAFVEALRANGVTIDGFSFWHEPGTRDVQTCDWLDMSVGASEPAVIKRRKTF